MDIAGLILGTMALIISVFNLIEYRSDKKSTHNIQFVPADSLELAKEQFSSEPAEPEAKKGKEKKAKKFLSIMPEDELDV